MTQLNTNIIEACRLLPIHVLIGNNSVARKAKILCPFHSENTPSCVLFPTGGFKCFGCGAHGNTVDFVMKLSSEPDEKERFREAINELIKYL